MANPLDYTQLIIKMIKTEQKDGTIHYPILHTNGKIIGTVVIGKRNFIGKLLSWFWAAMKKFLIFFPYMGQKIDIKILDSDDKPVKILKKPLCMTKFVVDIYDNAGRKQGTLAQVPPDSKVAEDSRKKQFNLVDYKGNFVAIFRGDWVAWNMQILDQNQKGMGKLSKKYADVNKVVHGSSNFYVGEIYHGKIDTLSQSLIMSCVSAMDIIAKD